MNELEKFKKDLRDFIQENNKKADERFGCDFMYDYFLYGYKNKIITLEEIKEALRQSIKDEEYLNSKGLQQCLDDIKNDNTNKDVSYMAEHFE